MNITIVREITAENSNATLFLRKLTSSNGFTDYETGICEGSEIYEPSVKVFSDIERAEKDFYKQEDHFLKLYENKIYG